MEDLFKPYVELLSRWNEAINLAKPGGGDERHFGDSLALLPYVDEDAMDVGSGAGFPGMVLAIAGAPVRALVESDGRKCVFLEEVRRLYGLDVEIINDRVENLQRKMPIITGRAFAPLERFFSLTRGVADGSTKYVLLKGERVKDEIKEARKSFRFEYDIKKKPGGVILIAAEVEAI